jgi:alkyldihydroxyacetonephosphate synthase
MFAMRGRVAMTRGDGESLKQSLRAILPADRILADATSLQQYDADWYWKSVAAAAIPEPLGHADMAALPITTEEVSAIVRAASAHGVPISPWGGGSGVNGASVPTEGGLVIDMRRMNNVLRVDKVSLVAYVQPGIICQAFEEYLNTMGLTFPHYPASGDLGTLGGYAACRGSGVASTRYGKMEDMTISIEVVLPDGNVIRTLAVNRHSCGPDLTNLFVGAEGTLGIITELTVRIARQPAGRSFAAATFASLQDGLNAGREIMHTGLRPSVIRLYDDLAAQHTLSKVVGPLERPTMVIVCEGDAAVAALEARRCVELCVSKGGKVEPSSMAEQWWSRRYEFYKPPHYPELPAIWGTIDVVGTFDKLMPTYIAMRSMLEERYGPRGLKLSTHLSHWYDWGSMLYFRFTIPHGPDDLREAVALHDQIWHDGVTLALDHGVVMNDHHGVGLKLAPFMRRQWGQGFETLKRIKEVVDPLNIMNPGKLGL